jgi:hypothetical protein
MERIDYRIPAVLVVPVAGRKKDDYIAVDSVPLQVALQGRAVNLDVLDRR